MANTPKPNQTLHRDSVTGRIVTDDYAESHRSTTERERVYNPQLPPAPAKKPTK